MNYFLVIEKFSFFHTVSNTRNMSVNISVDSLETLEETFFFLVGKDNISFWGSCVQEKKTDRKMHFINYYNNCIFPQVFYLNNKSYLNFLATCSKYVQFSIDLWKNHPNLGLFCYLFTNPQGFFNWESPSNMRGHS